MTRRIVLLTFLIISINGNSNDYYPIVKETSNWAVISGTTGTGGPERINKTSHYKFSGDTIIQSKAYKKILVSTDSLKLSWKKIGYAREDTILKKVWFRNLNDKEGLVYDFNLSLGKEVTICNPLYHPIYIDSTTYKLTRIDTISLQTEYRKVYTLSFNDFEAEQWIDGIGSKFGIVNSNMLGYTGGFRELLCFSGIENEYKNPKFRSCHVTALSPLFKTQNIDTAIENKEYSYQIKTTEIYENDSVTFKIYGSLPSELEFNKETGVISGIPVDTGIFPIIITINNNGYYTDKLEIDLIVIANNIPDTVKLDSFQNYYPIVKETSNWSVISGGFGSWMKICCVETNNYKISGDTTIHGKVYKKVFTCDDSLKLAWKLKALIREEINSKKVWLRDLDDKEGLIYDFSVTLGDEITVYNPFYYDSNTYTVTKIDSIFLNTEYRKVYTLSINDWEAEQWIEGIGSKLGIINCNFYAIPGGFSELLCFTDSDIKYINPDFQTCYKNKFTPTFTFQQIDTAYINQEYNFQLSTTDIFECDSISFHQSHQLPNGLTLDKNTGLISGTPNETGSFRITFLIENKGYTTDYVTLDFIVDNASNVKLFESKNLIKVYSNISTNILMVDNFNNLEILLRIIDMNGKQILLKSIEKDKCRIDIHDIPEGVYVISIFDNRTGKQLLNEKIIIN